MADNVRAFVVNSLNQFNTYLNENILPAYATYSYVENAYAYMLKTIEDNEYVTAYGLIQLNDRINNLNFDDYYALKSTLNSYVTKSQLSNQSYVTQATLSSQAYLTEHQSLSAYVKKADLANAGYVTYAYAFNEYPSYAYLNEKLINIDLSTYVSKTELSAQSYLTQHQDLSTYVSKTELSAQSYLTQHQDLSDYVTNDDLTAKSYVTSTDLTLLDYAPKTYVVDFVTDNIKEPEVIWEWDGVTGLYGHNGNSPDNNWQLENLDFSPYSRIECYFKSSNTASADSFTPAVIVTIQLDTAARGTTNYYGSVMIGLPFNRNREYLVCCAVDSTKTKFQVVHQNGLWDVSNSNYNTDGRYCYKIVGYYDDISAVIINGGGNGSGSGGITGINFNGTSATVNNSGIAVISAPINDSRVSIQMNGHTYSFTLNQSNTYSINLGTVLTQHQSLTDYVTKTELSNAGYITSGLPSVTASDNNKILMVVNGSWQLVSPSTIYSGNATPSNSNGNNGDIYIQS